MKGRTVVYLIVVAGTAFGVLMFWWARQVGFPRHPQVQAATSQGEKSAAVGAEASVTGEKGSGASTGTSTSTTSTSAATPAESKPEKSFEEKQAILIKAALAIQKRNAERYARALARWAAEKRDTHWAPGRENALRRALEDDNIEVTPDQLECRATLCRLALHPPNPLSSAPKMKSEIGDASAVGNEGTGASRMFIVFIPRAGQSLDT